MIELSPSIQREASHVAKAIANAAGFKDKEARREAIDEITRQLEAFAEAILEQADDTEE
jgi:hypothetical protein